MDCVDRDRERQTRLRVQNQLGLHTKPSAMIFKLAQSYPDNIFLVCGSQRADAKNLEDILMLGACQDTELHVEIEGDNASQILKSLRDLFDSKFGEE